MINNKFRLSKYCTIDSLLILIIPLLLSGCKKFVEVGSPRTELTRDLVFKNDATANAAMAGVYAQTLLDYFGNGGYFTDLAYICGKSADEIGLGADTDIDNIGIVENEIRSDNQRILSIWKYAYESIYRVNAILEGIGASSQVSEELKRQIEGEAKFMRAFNYFYIVNLFGDVPLLKVTDYRLNSVAPRNSINQVYEQILQDLIDAQQLLPADYSAWSNERVRPVQSAATALLARTYLYLNNWEKAETESSKVITRTDLYNIVGIDSVYLKNNEEALWQFYPPDEYTNTGHGVVAQDFYVFVPLTNELLQSFEVNDKRKDIWVWKNFDIDVCQRYKIAYSEEDFEYTTNLRLAEQYLVRAEARANLNNLGGAEDDLNMIRQRAGLSALSNGTKESLLEAVKQERRVELFVEYGHRWMDLKRWKEANSILAGLKPNWQITDTLYPIPVSERLRNKSLTQNPGYADN